MLRYTETLHRDYAQTFTVERLIYRDKTAHQDLVIFENALFGRVLALDGVIQTTERDNHIYHEMLAHVPILAHGGVREVLIVGGGDGGCLREVVKHPVARATMVEIDASVVAMSKEYLPSLSAGAFDDPRLDLVIADGSDYVRTCERRFDVVIIDSTDPIGPGEVLFTEAFYAACKALLTPGGILVTQSGVPALQPEEARVVHRRLAGLFADAAFYLAPVPTYVGGPMTLGWASDDAAHRRLDAEALRPRFAAAGIATRHYSPEVHVAAFALPPSLLALLD